MICCRRFSRVACARENESVYVFDSKGFNLNLLA